VSDMKIEHIHAITTPADMTVTREYFATLLNPDLFLQSGGYLLLDNARIV
jgi:hypothetical protein